MSSPMSGRARRERDVRALLPTIVLILIGSFVVTADAAEPSRLEPIEVRGTGLRAGGVPFKAFGFNWGVGTRSPVLDYFDRPTPARLRRLSGQMVLARSLGANSMRIPLELGQVMVSPTRARAETLRALERILAVAERHRVYLDITGNVVWRPELSPEWYDRLGERDRWRVQARFWRAVARVGARSPAVFCYELTSEPIVAETAKGGFYRGEFGGYSFVQAIAVRRGRDPRRLAREWTAGLAAAVREEDDRPVTIGLLPLTGGPFAPANVADLLDIVTVHEYPGEHGAAASTAVVESAAKLGKPVLLGETFQLMAPPDVQETFLRSTAPRLAGVLGFFDGRHPDRVGTTPGDLLYARSLRQMIDLRPLFRP